MKLTNYMCCVMTIMLALILPIKAEAAASFALAVNYAAGTSPRSVTTADFNRDGKVDMAVANFNSRNVRVFLNTTVPNSPPTASSVAIAGATNIGNTLTGSYTYTDVDSDLEGTSTFRWLRHGAAIGGATAQTYTLVEADSGTTITFEVTPVAATGTITGTAVSSVGTTTLNHAPAPMAPAITTKQGTAGTSQVTHNDPDMGDTHTYAITTGAIHGTTTVSSTGLTTYTPNAGYNGSDSFVVTVTDQGGMSGTVIVNVTVVPQTLQILLTDTDHDGVLDVDERPGDSDFDGIMDIQDPDDDGDGFMTIVEGNQTVDTDGDGTPDYLDLDSDNDGVLDRNELHIDADGDGFNNRVDTDDDGDLVPTVFEGDGTVDTDMDGLPNYLDTDDDGDTYLTATEGNQTVDTDGDGTPDYLDLDSDGDGVTDNWEFNRDTDFDGRNDRVDSDDDGDGIPTLAEGNQTVDTDHDGIPDYLDTDSDGDGVSDAQDAFRLDPAASVDTDGDGHPDAWNVGKTAADSTSVPPLTLDLFPNDPTRWLPNRAPTATGVTISGVARVGNTLTGAYTYADVDGDLEGASTFRWLRNGATITGATATTYALVAADSGTSITFEVTPVAATGTTLGTAVPSAGTTILNSAPTATGVTISGAARVGNTLTGAYIYADVDGDLEGASIFRWLRNGAAITGATTATYTLVAADSGKTIQFEVSPVAATGTSPGTAVASAGTAILNSAPTATGVTISGVAGVGNILTGTYIYADVDGDLEGASTFRWLRNGAAITGATTATYTMSGTDRGTSITFEVTPVAATGTTLGTAVASAGTTILNSAPTATGVTMSGTAKVGNILTGTYTYADVDGDLEGASTFRWLRNGAAITGATAATYALVTADSGKTIKFEVTPVAATGATLGAAVVSAGRKIINFSAAINFAVGTWPKSVTSADFNGDGKADMAVANSGGHSVSVLLGDGLGGFAAAVNFVTGTSPRSVTSADFNGDGKLDLAVANQGSSNVSVLLGDGLGGFAAAVNFAAGVFPFSVTSADFNGDGKTDMAVTNSGSSNVSVLLGDGLGGFAAAVNFAVGHQPTSVTSADFNGDGNGDLAVTSFNFNSGTVSVLLGDGLGGFAVAVNFAVQNAPMSVTSADFNGDGKADMAVANRDSASVSVLLGDGLGGFAAAVNFVSGRTPNSITNADFNGDGKMDLTMASYVSGNVYVLMGDGLGGFGAPVNFAVGTSPEAITSADFNGDGSADMAVANRLSGNVSVLFNLNPGLANPMIALSVNGSSFNSRTNKVMRLSATTVASNPVTNADVYLGLVLPDGTMLVMQPDGSFNTRITPIATNMPVPNFTGSMLNFTFTGVEPTGQYIWYAALMQPGTMNVIGTMAAVHFTFTP